MQKHGVAGARRGPFGPKRMTRQAVTEVVVPVFHHVFDEPSLLYDTVTMAIAGC